MSTPHTPSPLFKMVSDSAIKSLQTLLITNFILSLLSLSAVLIFMAVWFWKRAQSIRKELRENNQNTNTVFPITDKLPDDIPFSPIIPKSTSPSSILAHSLTSADFAAKTLLDKKVFAASGSVNKPISGLKDLI